MGKRMTAGHGEGLEDWLGGAEKGFVQRDGVGSRGGGRRNSRRFQARSQVNGERGVSLRCTAWVITLRRKEAWADVVIRCFESILEDVVRKVERQDAR